MEKPGYHVSIWKHDARKELLIQITSVSVLDHRFLTQISLTHSTNDLKIYLIVTVFSAKFGPLIEAVLFRMKDYLNGHFCQIQYTLPKYKTQNIGGWLWKVNGQKVFRSGINSRFCLYCKWYNLVVVRNSRLSAAIYWMYCLTTTANAAS